MHALGTEFLPSSLDESTIPPLVPSHESASDSSIMAARARGHRKVTTYKAFDVLRFLFTHSGLHLIALVVLLQTGNRE